MQDFFSNPLVRINLQSLDNSILNLVSELQRDDNAKKYYEDPSHLLIISDKCLLNHKILRSLIEGRELLFIPDNLD